MGAYDGAEVCELVGTYMLNLLSKKYNKNDFGLYRDDGLAVLKNKSGPQSEQVKKNIQKIFKDHGLDIIIQCNMKIVNYLDVTFNLNDGTYKPYTKPNNEIKYIHKNSNHPPSVIRQIPLSIESRLSTLSFNEKIFQEAVTPYQKALQNSGYRHTLIYKSPKNDNNSTNINKNKRNRKRQIIWFNPPFNLKTKTRIGKLFLNLLDKHFPPHNKLHKLFNRTNVKISYSCMPNMNSYTYMHNHKVLNDKPNEMGVNNCNCRNKDNCPLPNSCQTKCIIYQANIDCDIAGYKQKCYLGSCETTFKDRFGNHKKSFNHLKHKNDTELSKEFWEIKKRNGTPKITWKIIRICPSYNPNSKRCLLCLNEKYEIATYKGNNLLNKRTEIINTCRHRSKYKLANCETID